MFVVWIFFVNPFYTAGGLRLSHGPLQPRATLVNHRRGHVRETRVGQASLASEQISRLVPNPSVEVGPKGAVV